MRYPLFWDVTRHPSWLPTFRDRWVVLKPRLITTSLCRVTSQNSQVLRMITFVHWQVMIDVATVLACRQRLLRVREMKALRGVRACPCVQMFYVRSCSTDTKKFGIVSVPWLLSAIVSFGLCWVSVTYRYVKFSYKFRLIILKYMWCLVTKNFVGYWK